MLNMTNALRRSVSIVALAAGLSAFGVGSSAAQSAPSAGFTSLMAVEGTAMAPRLSTAMLLAQPENRALHDLVSKAPADPQLYKGKRVAIVTTDGVEEIELMAILKYFRDRGAATHVVSPRKPIYPAQFGVQMPAIRETHILTIRYMDLGGWTPFDRLVEDVKPEDYDALIIPGGAWNPDALRANPTVLNLVKGVAAAGKPVAAICHGPWVLGDAGLLKGRRATAWWWMQNDVRGAGATYIDEPVVVDGNVVTSRAPGDIPQFVAAIGEKLLGRSVLGM